MQNYSFKFCIKFHCECHTKTGQLASTTSSGQNSLAATLLADIIRPIFHRCTGRDLSSRRSIRIAELTGEHESIVKAKLMKYLAIHTNYMLHHCTTLQYKHYLLIVCMLVVGLFLCLRRAGNIERNTRILNKPEAFLSDII